jgi:hypothetical protein
MTPPPCACARPPGACTCGTGPPATANGSGDQGLVGRMLAPVQQLRDAGREQHGALLGFLEHEGTRAPSRREGVTPKRLLHVARPQTQLTLKPPAVLSAPPMGAVNTARPPKSDWTVHCFRQHRTFVPTPRPALLGPFTAADHSQMRPEVQAFVAGGPLPDWNAASSLIGMTCSLVSW